MGNGPSNDSCRSPKNSDGADTPDAGLAANLLAWKGAWKSRKGLHGRLGRKKPRKDWSLRRRKMAWSENIMRGNSSKIESCASCPGLPRKPLSASKAGLASRRKSANSVSYPELSTLASEAPPVRKSSPEGEDSTSSSPQIPALLSDLSPTTDSSSRSLSSDSTKSVPIKTSNVKTTKSCFSVRVRGTKKLSKRKKRRKPGGKGKRKPSKSPQTSSPGKLSGPAIQPRWK